MSIGSSENENWSLVVKSDEDLEEKLKILLESFNTFLKRGQLLLKGGESDTNTYLEGGVFPELVGFANIYYERVGKPLPSIVGRIMKKIVNHPNIYREIITTALNKGYVIKVSDELKPCLSRLLDDHINFWKYASLKQFSSLPIATCANVGYYVKKYTKNFEPEKMKALEKYGKEEYKKVWKLILKQKLETMVNNYTGLLKTLVKAKDFPLQKDKDVHESTFTTFPILPLMKLLFPDDKLKCVKNAEDHEMLYFNNTIERGKVTVVKKNVYEDKKSKMPKEEKKKKRMELKEQQYKEMLRKYLRLLQQSRARGVEPQEFLDEGEVYYFNNVLNYMYFLLAEKFSCCPDDIKEVFRLRGTRRSGASHAH